MQKNSNKKSAKSRKRHQTQRKTFSFYFDIGYSVIKSLLKLGIILLFLLGALGLGTGLGYMAYLVKDTEVPERSTLQNELNDVEQVSHMVYNNGEKIGDLKSDLLRTSVSYEQISPLVKKAIIATEDENFMTHHGVVPKALLRAMMSTVGIGGSSGGSTLTQQLVKQQVLTDEQTFKRKAQEIVLSMRVEKFFSKEEILTAYLNVSPFGRNNSGQNIAGIQEAAKGIFGKDAKDVNLAQAAFLAGLPQSPITYSPYTNTGDLKKDLSEGIERKNIVLFNMYREKYINQQEYTEAQQYDLAKDFLPKAAATQDDNGYLYHLVQKEATKALMPSIYGADGKSDKDVQASEELQKKYYELAERQLRRNGYTVHTTIDKNIYSVMQQTTQNIGYLLDDGNGQTVQVGNVLMENQTGKILGFVGGRDYAQNQNNHSFDTYRPAGSTMKPIAAYAPALELGFIGSQTQLSNFPTRYETNGQEVHNYGSQTGNNFESVQEALKKSDNIPVVNLYRELRKKADPSTFMKKMTFEKLTDEYYATEAFPLGQNDVSVAEQTAAYAALANQGTYHNGYIIDKITTPNGQTVYQHKNQDIAVFSKATASIMNDMMRNVVNSGTGSPAKVALSQINPTLSNADWVGKTGTSEFETDFWFIASTPTVTLSSWIGYDDNTVMASNNDKQNKLFWANMANAIYQQNPNLFATEQRFTLDPSVIKAEVSDFTGTKIGNFHYENKNYRTPGKKIVALFSNEKAIENPMYKFGIGGTDDNYRTAWSAQWKKPNPTSNPSRNDRNSNQPNNNNTDNNQNRSAENSNVTNLNPNRNNHVTYEYNYYVEN